MEQNHASSSDPYDKFFDSFHEEIEAARQGGDTTPVVAAPADTEQTVLDDFFDGFHEDILRARLGEDTAAARGLGHEVARRRQQQ